MKGRYFSIASLLFITFFECFVLGDKLHCQSDCRSNTTRWPTRPWYQYDQLGNKLSLTRPYPYYFEADIVTLIYFDVHIKSIQCHFTKSFYPDPSYYNRLKNSEKKYGTQLLMRSMNHLYSYQVKHKQHEFVINETIKDDEIDPENVVELINTFQVKVIPQHNGYNKSTFENFIANNIQSFLLEAEPSNYNHLLQPGISTRNQQTNCSHTIRYELDENGILKFEHEKITYDRFPNKYSKFCEFGCSVFYSLTFDPLHLDNCTSYCDKFYQYNISVGYNDRIEIARLECRDGCQQALIRCKPGYYCSQVELKIPGMNYNGNNSSNRTVEKNIDDRLNYLGGTMMHCPAGTYRDYAYDSVEECVPCPPGRFREDIKGRNLESCTKCPAGTYTSHFGSTSIRDCLRCPAGTFTVEPGSSFCICITKDSCREDQLPSPADAEKKHTIPFIGRW